MKDLAVATFCSAYFPALNFLFSARSVNDYSPRACSLKYKVHNTHSIYVVIFLITVYHTLESIDSERTLKCM